MLLKKATAKGDPIPYTAEEALPFAIEYGAKQQNDLSTVYWVVPDSVVKVTFHSMVTTDPENPSVQGWEATATGTAMIGRTDAKTDRFYQARLHDFSVSYRSSADALNLPDIEVVSFSMGKVNTDPLAGR